MLDDVTAVIAAFERPGCVDMLLKSLKRHHPEMPIVVADNSKEPPGHELADRYLCLPFDCGLARTRNEALAEVETPYFALLDDDFVVQDPKHLERMAELARGGIDLVGGDCVNNEGKPAQMPYIGTITKQDRRIVLSRDYSDKAEDYIRCEICYNFFVARTAAVRETGGWDNQLKLHEHVDFFLRFKEAGFRCVFCPRCTIWHRNVKPPHYRKFREREFRNRVLAKWGVQQLNLFGVVYPPGEQQVKQQPRRKQSRPLKKRPRR